jgi:hypothetical protein
MSRTYDVVCKQCRVTLWIGQHSARLGRMYVYNGEHHLDQLAEFLQAHLDHPLTASSSETYAEYRSVDKDDDDEPTC